ncbi:MAG: DUF2254 domain-containing protein [uncultured Thiotrichaceae bacterium]|uniref:DUF2254 domain-containing protein n=1 Tax=uncultured Thiotrichaceae bacterium TaxID=298394 RepID=A0A6S6SAZ2_9GAMM|nr:MAG: DUF2254 domain-containing protein [uncultured Thiotrichaceae bacterium]
MKTRILHWLEIMSATFWLIPLVLLIAAILLAYVNIHLDKLLFSESPFSFLFYFNDKDNIRTLLSLTGGAILGVAGVTFSITIASLTLASQQFGPRLLRNFMQNYFNQIVIGIFISTFLYSVLILQFTDAMDEKNFVPVISMSTLLALIILNLLILVFFIHHTAASIQADTVIDDVYQELESRLYKLFPDTGETTSQQPTAQLPDDLQKRFANEGQPVCAQCSGYLQALDHSALQSFTTEQDLTLRMNFRPGDFIIKGCELATCLSPEKLDDEIATTLDNALIVGNKATAEQDAEYAIRQLVEIALRALSPGINDPFTAISCINRLGQAIAFVAKREFPNPNYFDDNTKLRLLLAPLDFEGMVEAAFNQIRQNTSHHVDIIISLLDTFQHLAVQVQNEVQAKVLLTQVEAIQQTCVTHIEAEMDKAAINERYEHIQATLKSRFPIAIMHSNNA